MNNEGKINFRKHLHNTNLTQYNNFISTYSGIMPLVIRVFTKRKYKKIKKKENIQYIVKNIL